MAQSFLEASIPDLVKRLKVDEKISLLGAPNWWNTTAIPRLGIPSVRMSDGPNGVRGSSHFVSTPTQCLPCSTSLASTFDPELVQQVGAFLGQEAKIKSSVLLLAPTCNIQRTPLGGRAFESFSEDPHLSGVMAAAYVNGLQSEGVSAVIKHFVGNDQEHERLAADSVMSDRALREVYLYPFMLAQRDAQPWAFMTSYGRLKGVHCSENPGLLQGILRGEWGFKGIVISDWYGTYGVNEAINAGLDLEMPGPPRWRQQLLVLQNLSTQKVLQQTIDDRVTTLLTFAQQQARRNPKVVFGDGIERTRDTPENRAFCRKLASDGMVLLKNSRSVLPLSPERVKRVAVIGPNAKERVVSGGGSAALKPSYAISPWDGITQNAPSGIEFTHHIGCYAHKYLPTLENNLTTSSGESGWLCTFYAHDEKNQPSIPVADFILRDTRIKLNDFIPPGLGSEWTIKLTGKLLFDKTTDYELGLTVAGRAKLWVNGELTIDNWTKQTPGDFFYGQGTIEEKAVVKFTAGRAVDVLVEYTNTASATSDDDQHGDGRISQPALMRGVRFGGCEKIDAEHAIQEAVALAAKSDAVIFVGGLTPEWESEGFDRPTLDMPGLQNQTVARLAAANPNTIVVIQAGSAVSMPWVDSVSGILQAWYSGNEVGNALSDVLFGTVNPNGRLPLTLPVRVQDVPAYLNDRCENGKIHYREDIFVGYKYYQVRDVKPLFPFGYGLSYTTFSLHDLQVSVPSALNVASQIKVSASLKNEGQIAGSEVLQIYVSYPDLGLATPRYQLRGFKKAQGVAPNASQKVEVTLNKYAFSLWDESQHTWRVNAGRYGIHAGFSSDNLPLTSFVEISETFYWSGL
ncbi:glycoside hydrolase family 3 protein [Macrolepiota fuliginosa MF-IS2]|uniref:beta-glucosidase n=1 Tax=Macrolepiota fuliginosa MF-IS2 TaxID=1400762 RepID=A0A9P5XI98_9AGAR|nr:glycoside hydrolase family 3 protein [Macrolepiota fuliginosa MF-IS2]